MKNKYFFNIIIPFMITVILSCNQKKSEEVATEEHQLSNVKVPDFNADSAYIFIKNQVDFGPRVPNTQIHDQCAEFLINKLKVYNAEVTVQEFQAEAFDGKILSLKNIVGSFNPKNPKRILLAAHWDTRPFADKDTVRKKEPIPGANDGGSGVGVLLEIARIISNNPTYQVGVDIILFDGEDYGDPSANEKETYCLGSQYWAKTKHQANYSAYYGILLDMVGAKNAKFPQEEYSLRYARQIVGEVWDAGDKLGFGEYFVEYQDGPITDDHRFINEIAKIPMIDIIELDPLNGFGDYHHTHRDNMDIIDTNTLKAVGQTLLYVLYNEQPLEKI